MCLLAEHQTVRPMITRSKCKHALGLIFWGGGRNELEQRRTFFFPRFDHFDVVACTNVELKGPTTAAAAAVGGWVWSQHGILPLAPPTALAAGQSGLALPHRFHFNRSRLLPFP